MNRHEIHPVPLVDGRPDEAWLDEARKTAKRNGCYLTWIVNMGEVSQCAFDALTEALDAKMDIEQTLLQMDLQNDACLSAVFYRKFNRLPKP